MGSKRTPVNRRHRIRITPQAVALFCRWWEEGDTDAERQLCRLLGLRPWEFIEPPDTPQVHTPGTASHEFAPHAHELWRLLQEAVEARKLRLVVP